MLYYEVGSLLWVVRSSSGSSLGGSLLLLPYSSMDGYSYSNSCFKNLLYSITTTTGSRLVDFLRSEECGSCDEERKKLQHECVHKICSFILLPGTVLGSLVVLAELVLYYCIVVGITRYRTGSTSGRAVI